MNTPTKNWGQRQTEHRFYAAFIVDITTELRT